MPGALDGRLYCWCVDCLDFWHQRTNSSEMLQKKICSCFSSPCHLVLLPFSPFRSLLLLLPDHCFHVQLLRMFTTGVKKLHRTAANNRGEKREENEKRNGGEAYLMLCLTGENMRQLNLHKRMSNTAHAHAAHAHVYPHVCAYLSSSILQSISSSIVFIACRSFMLKKL